MAGVMNIVGAQTPSGRMATVRFLRDLQSPFIIGLVAVALATIARLSLEPVLTTHGPFLFFAIGAVMAALYGGAVAGVVATFLSLPACDYLFIEPRYTWFIHDAPGDSIMLVLFAALGLFMVAIIHRFHRATRRLKQSLMDLQETESKLEMIAATVPEILFTATGDGGVEYLNGHFSQYSGREMSELVEHGWLDLIHPNDRARMEAELSMRLKIPVEFGTSIRLRRADGACRWFKWHAKPAVGSDGKVEKWFGVCSDIDDEKNLTAALESRTRELLRLNEGLECFAHAASHDLQAPLHTIGAMTQLFLRRCGESLDPKSTEPLALVVKCVEQMSQLIRDILEFAKACNTTQEESPRIDSGAVAQLAIANLDQAVKESGAKVTIDQLPVIRVNKSAMLRLFQNLIGNAIKYRGENTPQIHISASRGQGEWVFSIRDNGIGIDPRYHNKIFEPFKRLHGQSRYEGSGLGLSACRRIVQSLEGRIWLESKPGEGSTFFFTLPEGNCEEATTL